MITLRRAQQRYDDRRGDQSAWLTFYSQAAEDHLAEGFGGLQRLDELHVPPGGSIQSRAQRDSEILTYVLDGALAYHDSLGRSGVLQAGEFRCVTASRGGHPRDKNTSRDDWTHLFQIGLRTSGASSPNEQQKRFNVADRRNRLCLVAADEASGRTLRLHEDALVYSALLAPGQHLVHDLRSDRRAWLHVVSGEVVAGDLRLTKGDGAGVTAERCVSFTARGDAEVLLVDVA